MANERLTWFGVTYDLSDRTALGDSTPTTDDNKSFGNIGLLKNYDYSQRYMTLEHNFTLLDGVQPEINSEVQDVAFFSDEISDEDGYFINNPTVEIDFTIYHSSFALTLYFDEEHPLQVRIRWFRDDLQLVNKLYDVTDPIQVIPTDVELYNKIIIEFVRTLPYHYAKMYSIRYGVVVEWDETNLKKGTIVQELNRISEKIPINTMSFEVVDVNHGLNFGNIDGVHKYYQRNQEMVPYELVNGQRIEFGKYYLNKFSSEKNLGKMTSVSAMGLLDTIQFNGGGVYNSGVSAKTLIDAIFEMAKIENYTIDEETANTILYGALPPMNCRNALKEVLFACNSVIDTSQDPMRIFKYKRSVSHELTRATKFSTKITKNTYISGVEVKFNNYALAEEPSDALKNTYEPGTYTVVLNTPYTEYTITGGTLISTSAYLVTFSCAEAGEVIIQGKKYDSSEASAVINAPYIEPGEVANIKTFTSKLCNAKTASNLAETLLDELSKERLIFNIQHIAVDNDMNGGADIENPVAKYKGFLGWYNKRTFDMTGGFIDNAQLYGNYVENELYYFTGTELYSGENIII